MPSTSGSSLLCPLSLPRSPQNWGLTLIGASPGLCGDLGRDESNAVSSRLYVCPSDFSTSAGRIYGCSVPCSCFGPSERCLNGATYLVFVSISRSCTYGKSLFNLRYGVF